MTFNECIKTIDGRKKGQAYHIWKQAYLIGLAFSGKNFPKSPEIASPELYPQKTRIKMPSNLLNKIRSQ